MNFFQNLSIRTKLILLSLVPVIGLLYYLQIAIRADLTNRDIAQQVILDVRAIDQLSKVVHEFQKERALTLSFLSGATSEIKSAIIGQRESTDNAIFSLEKVLKEQGRVIAGYTLIDSLAVIRAKVNASKPEAQIDPFYREIKAILLDAVSEILRSSENLSLKNHFEEHLFLF